MGYTTDFNGHLTLSKNLSPEQKSYINTFSATRRMARDPHKLMLLYKGKYGYPSVADNELPEKIYGPNGEYFAREDGDFGQTEDSSIIDFNTPPGNLKYDKAISFNDVWRQNRDRIESGECTPGLWCKWRIVSQYLQDDRLLEYQILEWDQREKFYEYVPWLKYLIKHFFEPWGVLLNGEIYWDGEDSTDKGLIVVTNNVVQVKYAKITYE